MALIFGGIVEALAAQSELLSEFDTMPSSSESVEYLELELEFDLDLSVSDLVTVELYLVWDDSSLFDLVC